MKESRPQSHGTANYAVYGYYRRVLRVSATHELATGWRTPWQTARGLSFGELADRPKVERQSSTTWTSLRIPAVYLGQGQSSQGSAKRRWHGSGFQLDPVRQAGAARLQACRAFIHFTRFETSRCGLLVKHYGDKLRLSAVDGRWTRCCI